MSSKTCQKFFDLQLDVDLNLGLRFRIVPQFYGCCFSLICFILFNFILFANCQSISSRDFYESTAFWCPRAQVSLNLENRDLNCRNLRSMLKISCAACPCLSQLVSAQFALAMCLAARNRQKIHKPPILAFKVIQGNWIGRQSRASVRLPISD